MAESAAQGSLTSGNSSASAPEGGVLLGGIDGGTPLGFLAALGLLRIWVERQGGDSEAGSDPRLSWRQLDAWRPSFHGPTSLDEIAVAVHEDAGMWAQAPLLQFRYVKLEKKGPKTVGGLKAPVAVLRAWLIERRKLRDEASLAYAAALMCESTTEEIANPATLEQQQEAGIAVSQDVRLDQSTERTFFDFTARNAQFIEQLEHIRAHLDPNIIRAALERGESDPNTPRSMDWDPAADTPGAIYTGYRRGFLPAHEWLAFRGLVHFPITGQGTRVRNTACSGRRLDGELCWPLWSVPAGLDAVRSLVAYPGLARLNADGRRALGIVTVLCAGLTKKADGRSGTFSPSRPSLVV